MSRNLINEVRIARSTLAGVENLLRQRSVLVAEVLWPGAEVESVVIHHCMVDLVLSYYDVDLSDLTVVLDRDQYLHVSFPIEHLGADFEDRANFTHEDSVLPPGAPGSSEYNDFVESRVFEIVEKSYSAK